MPKAKPKVPKTEKMWMAWSRDAMFAPWIWGVTKETCRDRASGWQYDRIKEVRIVPEAEYQRMRKAAGKMVKEG